jgi:hypothetical protein
MSSGQLRPMPLRDAHLTQPERRGEPWCTQGQMVRYVDADGQWLVEVFQYARPDGTIGASGMPDPKRLRVGSTIYVVSPEVASTP